MRLRIGTRGSQLALTQSGHVAAALRDLGHEIEMVIVKTAGDADRTSAFVNVGPAGVFVREIQSALLAGEIDLAVHSYKDLPSDGPAGLEIAAVPPREDPRDRLIVRADAWVPDAEHLPLGAGARVGTASARRIALLRELRPDLEPTHIRGNVNTRLGRLRSGDFDAIVLAAAGLVRLRSGDLAGDEVRRDASLHEHDLDPRVFVPAPSQGALALEVRADDEPVRNAVAALDDGATRHLLEGERTLLALLQAGCQVAFGAWCEPEGDTATLHATLDTEHGLRQARFSGPDPVALAHLAHDALTGKGGES